MRCKRLGRLSAAMAAVLMVSLGATPAHALGLFNIELVAAPGLLTNPDALASFERAAQAWEAYISSPVRINVSADLEPIGIPNLIGVTGLADVPLNLDYTTVRNAMAARSVRPGNEILAYLPTTTQISANVPTALGSTFVTTTIGLTPANQKALGLIPGGPAVDTLDGVIIFNSDFTFDYDSRDGITPGMYDFQTAATHELGHILGFLSDTDGFDAVPGLSDNATTLDLFRFNRNALPVTPGEFTLFPRELTPGQPAAFTDLINVFDMSTGANNGDGNQASHWEDDFYIHRQTGALMIGPLVGIMDPTLPSGFVETISAADLRVMELIGYDTVPEPGALAVLALGGALFSCRRRRSDRGV